MDGWKVEKKRKRKVKKKVGKMVKEKRDVRWRGGEEDIKVDGR